MLQLYLDVSCLNRPFDDQSQSRIRLESEAVLMILQRVDSNRWRMVSSGMAEIEIDAMPDPERRRRMLATLPDEQDRISLTAGIMKRAMEIQKLGLKAADAVHLAAAEAIGADVFLTCDDRLTRVGVRKKSSLRVRVMNPLAFLEEQGDAANT